MITAEKIIEDLCGKRYLEASLSKIDFSIERTKKIIEWMKTCKDGQMSGKLLLISTNAGVGKTYLCAAMFKELFMKVPSCRYWNEQTFFSRLKGCIEKGWDIVEEMERLCDDHVLIMDDFGVSTLTDWKKEIWQAFIDFRYKRKLPTMITTNMTTNQITDSFHERFSSRLLSGENIIIEFQGEDRRKLEGSK